MDSLTDTVSLSFLRELVDWAEVDPLLTRLADVKKARCLTVTPNPTHNPSRSQATCCWAEVDPLLTRLADVNKARYSSFAHTIEELPLSPIASFALQACPHFARGCFFARCHTSS